MAEAAETSETTGSGDQESDQNFFTQERLLLFAVEYERRALLWDAARYKKVNKSRCRLACSKLAKATGARRGVTAKRMLRLCRLFHRLLFQELVSACAEASRRGPAARADQVWPRLPLWARRAETYLGFYHAALAAFQKARDKNKDADLATVMQSAVVPMPVHLQSLEPAPGCLARRLLRAMAASRAATARAACAVAATALGRPRDELLRLWIQLRTASLSKLRELLKRGDQPGQLPPALRPTPLDWAAADRAASLGAMLCRERDFKQVSSLRSLLRTFHVVQRHGLEPAADPRAWRRAARDYCKDGHQCSALVLQRRWHELKQAARRALLALWRGPGACAPPTLLQAVARRYPHVVTDPPVSWSQLLKDGLLAPATSENGPAPGEARGDDSPNSSETETADDDEVILVEKTIETITLDDDTDPPITARSPLKIAPSPPKPKDVSIHDLVDPVASTSGRVQPIPPPPPLRHKNMSTINLADPIPSGSRSHQSGCRGHLTEELQTNETPKSPDSDNVIEALKNLDVNAVQMTIQFDDDDDFEDDETNDDEFNVNRDVPGTSQSIDNSQVTASARMNTDVTTKDKTSEACVTQSRDSGDVIQGMGVQKVQDIISTLIDTCINKNLVSEVDRVSENKRSNTAQRSRGDSSDSDCDNLTIDADYVPDDTDIDDDNLNEMDSRRSADNLYGHHSNLNKEKVTEITQFENRRTYFKKDDGKSQADCLTANTSSKNDAMDKNQQCSEMETLLLNRVVPKSDSDAKDISNPILENNEQIADTQSLNSKIENLQVSNYNDELNEEQEEISAESLDLNAVRHFVSNLLQSLEYQNASNAICINDEPVSLDQNKIDLKGDFNTETAQTSGHVPTLNKLCRNTLSGMLTGTKAILKKYDETSGCNLKGKCNVTKETTEKEKEDKIEVKLKNDFVPGVQTTDDFSKLQKDNLKSKADCTQVVRTSDSDDTTNVNKNVITEVTHPSGDAFIDQSKQNLEGNCVFVTGAASSNGVKTVKEVERGLNSKINFHKVTPTSDCREPIYQKNTWDNLVKVLCDVKKHTKKRSSPGNRKSSAQKNVSSTKNKFKSATTVHRFNDNIVRSETNKGHSNENFTKDSDIEIVENSDSAEPKNNAVSAENIGKESPSKDKIVGGHLIKNPLLLQLLRAQSNDTKRSLDFTARSKASKALNQNNAIENVTDSNVAMDIGKHLEDSNGSSNEDKENLGEIDPKLIMYPVVELDRLDLPLIQRNWHDIRRITLFDPSLAPRYLFKKSNIALLEMCRPCEVSIERVELGERDSRGRVAKRVELPDIEEVRRNNRNILTAQVAPITIDVDEAESRVASRLRKRAARRDSRGPPTAGDLQKLLNQLAGCAGSFCQGCVGCAARRLAEPAAPGGRAAAAQAQLLRLSARRAQTEEKKMTKMRARLRAKEQKKKVESSKPSPRAAEDGYSRWIREKNVAAEKFGLKPRSNKKKVERCEPAPEDGYSRWIREKNVAAEKFGLKPRSFKKKVDEPTAEPPLITVPGELSSSEKMDTLKRLSEMPSGNYVISNDGSIYSVDKLTSTNTNVTVPDQTPPTLPIVFNQTSNPYLSLTEENLLAHGKNQPIYKLDTNLFNPDAVADINKKLNNLTTDNQNTEFNPVISNVQSLADIERKQDKLLKETFLSSVRKRLHQGSRDERGYKLPCVKSVEAKAKFNPEMTEKGTFSTMKKKETDTNDGDRSDAMRPPMPLKVNHVRAESDLEEVQIACHEIAALQTGSTKYVVIRSSKPNDPPISRPNPPTRPDLIVSSVQAGSSQATNQRTQNNPQASLQHSQTNQQVNVQNAQTNSLFHVQNSTQNRQTNLQHSQNNLIVTLRNAENNNSSQFHLQSAETASQMNVKRIQNSPQVNVQNAQSSSQLNLEQSQTNQPVGLQNTQTNLQFNLQHIQTNQQVSLQNTQTSSQFNLQNMQTMPQINVQYIQSNPQVSLQNLQPNPQVNLLNIQTNPQSNLQSTQINQNISLQQIQTNSHVNLQSTQINQQLNYVIQNKKTYQTNYNLQSGGTLNQASNQVNILNNQFQTYETIQSQLSSRFNVIMSNSQNSLPVNSMQAGPSLLVGNSYITNPLGVLPTPQVMPLNSVQAGPSVNSILVQDNLKILPPPVDVEPMQVVTVQGGPSQDSRPQASSSLTSSVQDSCSLASSVQDSRPQAASQASPVQANKRIVRKCGLFHGLTVDPSSMQAMPAERYIAGRDPTTLAVLAGAWPAGARLLVREAAAPVDGPLFGLSPPCRLLIQGEDQEKTPAQSTFTPEDPKGKPWLKVKSFAKMPDDSATQGPQRPGACSQLRAPSRVFLRDKVYQKLCDQPLTYAKVLTAVTSASELRALAARLTPLFVYSLSRGGLCPVGPELSADGDNVIFYGPEEVSEFLKELADVIVGRAASEQNEKEVGTNQICQKNFVLVKKTPKVNKVKKLKPKPKILNAELARRGPLLHSAVIEIDSD